MAIFNTKLWELKVRGNIWATKNGGNEQNGFFWILGLLKCFNGFENSHTDWIGYLNMICGEKKVKLGNIWAGRIPQSIKNYSWKSNDFVIFFQD